MDIVGKAKDKPYRTLNLLNGYEMTLGKFDLFCLIQHSTLRRYVSCFKSPSQSSFASISRMRSIVHGNNKFALKHYSLFYELICEEKMTINHGTKSGSILYGNWVIMVPFFLAENGVLFFCDKCGSE